MTKETHILKGQFGRDISLDFTRPDGDRDVPVVVFLHGFKGFKDWGAWHLVAKYFVEAGYAFCKFNFSHGGVDHKNPNDLTDLNAFAENNFLIELSDTSMVLDWIEKKSGLDSRNINLIGHSRAGGIALITAKEQERVRKVITWAAVSDYHRYIGAWNIEQWEKDGFLPFVNSRTKQVFNINYTFFEVLEANEELLDIKAVCMELTKPVLVAHSKNDAAVSYTQAEELADWLENSELLLLEEGGHTFDTYHPYTDQTLSENMETVCKRTVDFIGK